ncbi:hypothetical protein [Komagataeibacter sp. FNDCF1]|uniref:hypothetical protein n=1 Tax=Komagataeibacter sp. FNDCF1 TaxID=2878681 RepID=UPI001E2A9B24|nr:hypothetical protein [Komagataeibacter sp. FNDCF1]MCE2566137.1 hypothetical protein [Komagataeibacter sp. FNDCF1]
MNLHHHGLGGTDPFPATRLFDGTAILAQRPGLAAARQAGNWPAPPPSAAMLRHDMTGNRRNGSLPARSAIKDCGTG